MDVVAGPIPGENFTSDTKNYPWHRPPEFDDLDKAIEYASKKLTNTNTSISMMTLAKSGMPLSTIAQTFLMQGMSRGKWTPDYALLMAGPVTHILSLMAKASKVDYTLGIEDNGPLYTQTFFDELAKLDEDEVAATQVASDVISMGMDGDEPELEAPGEPPMAGGMEGSGFVGMAAGAPPEAPTDPSMMTEAGQMPETPDINMVGE